MSRIPPSRLALVNPNTNAATTDTMVAIAREAAGSAALIEGRTAPFGVPLILNEPALTQAAAAVLALAFALAEAGVDGVIVSAFGDPGLEALRAVLSVPVTGIAEAGMAEAARDEAGRKRPFAVVTTTADLAAAITAAAHRYGHGEVFRGVELTPGDPAFVMADPDRVTDALGAACARAIAERGAAALVIGGGPLALAARRLAGRFAVPIVEPVPAAVRLALRRAAAN